jgi:hypothetical protein
MKWNSSRELTLNKFLAEQAVSRTKFFDEPEPWLVGLNEIEWTSFFRVCAEEMDDLSLQATKLVVEYCLEIIEEIEEEIKGKPSLALVETRLSLQYAEQYENKAYQYR